MGEDDGECHPDKKGDDKQMKNGERGVLEAQQSIEAFDDDGGGGGGGRGGGCYRNSVSVQQETRVSRLLLRGLNLACCCELHVVLLC